MTPFNEFQAEGTRKTDKRVSKLLALILALYKEAYRDILVELRLLYAEYQGSPVQYRSLYEWLVLTSRLDPFMDKVTAIYRECMSRTRDRIKEAVKVAAEEEFNRSQFAFLHLEPSLSRVAVPASALSLIVEGSPSAYAEYMMSETSAKVDPSSLISKAGELESILKANMESSEGRLRQKLLNSLTIGMSLAETSRAVHSVIGMARYKDGRKVATGGLGAMMKVGRSETMRGLNAGHYMAGMLLLGQLSSSVAIPQRMWVAVLDSGTRIQSAEMNGQTVGLDEPFVYPNGATSMYPGQSGYPEYDVNCRCSVIDIIEGLDNGQSGGIDPATGKNVSFSWKGYGDWL